MPGVTIMKSLPNSLRMSAASWLDATTPSSPHFLANLALVRTVSTKLSVLVSLVKTVAVIVGLILFIVPGIIIGIKLQFASYLVVDKNMGVVDALNKSSEMTKGIKMNLFLFGILLFLINVLGFLALIVGLLVTIPLSMVATAYVYRKLS